MTLAAGCHHIALLTQDMDRFLDFYDRMFDAEIVFDVREGPMRHAMVELGGGFMLHPFSLPETLPDAVGQEKMFTRGHLDHLAIDMGSRGAFYEARERLVSEGATDGTITDWGLVAQVVFHDPDGMETEISVRKAGRVLDFDERIHVPYPERLPDGH